MSQVPGCNDETADLAGFGTGFTMVDGAAPSVTAAGSVAATSTGLGGSAGVAAKTAAGGVGGTGKPS
jgi:hypothetical protein